MLTVNQRSRYVPKRLVLVMSAGIHLRQPKGQALAYLTQEAEVEAD